jgi:hypothetical protein
MNKKGGIMDDTVFDFHEEARIRKDEEEILSGYPPGFDPDLMRDDPDNPYVEATESAVEYDDDEVEVTVIISEDDAYQIARSAPTETIREIAFQALRKAIKAQVFNGQALY